MFKNRLLTLTHCLQSQMNRLLIILFLGISITGCKQDSSLEYSDDKNAIQAYSLIDPLEAMRLLEGDQQTYIPVQVSKPEVFDKGHIPNAIQIWRPDYTSNNKTPVSGLIPSRKKLELLIRSFGFEEGDTLIIYDAKANVDAMRFAWTLSLYGFDDYKLVNGGLQHWKENGLMTTSTVSPIAKSSNFSLGMDFKDDMIADFEEVRNALQDTNTVLLDTREFYEYAGQPFFKKNKLYDHKSGAYARGSIPNAIHHNWSEMADLNGDHRIKSEKTLRYDLNRKGITPDKKIILYCQSGSRTTHSYYVLKHILGYKDVKNYDGSWIEWSYNHTLDENVPIYQHLDDAEFIAYKDSLMTIKEKALKLQ